MERARQEEIRIFGSVGVTRGHHAWTLARSWSRVGFYIRQTLYRVLANNANVRMMDGEGEEYEDEDIPDSRSLMTDSAL